MLPKIEPTTLPPKPIWLLSASNSGQPGGLGFLRPKTWGGQTGQVHVGVGGGACSPGLYTPPVGSEGQLLDPELLRARPLISAALMCSHLLMWTRPDLAALLGRVHR